MIQSEFSAKSFRDTKNNEDSAQFPTREISKGPQVDFGDFGATAGSRSSQADAPPQKVPNLATFIVRHGAPPTGPWEQGEGDFPRNV